MLRERRSFAVEDLTVDTELLESARQAGYTTKVFFISTEDLSFAKTPAVSFAKTPADQLRCCNIVTAMIGEGQGNFSP